MKKNNVIKEVWCAGIFLFASLLTGLSSAAGLLTPSDGSLPALEIKDHQVNVVIEDGYAITTVEQVFVNPHNKDLEAQYSFPVPDHGSVIELTMWIDGKPVTAEVMEINKAREVYEEEKAAGREAGITEKDSYKTFETRISPVRAGQDTRIRLVYLQHADVDTGIGRYVYPLEEGGVDEDKLAFWTANETVTGTFSFDVRIKSAYPVDAVRTPNQPQATVLSKPDGEWNIHLGNQLAVPANVLAEGEKEEGSLATEQGTVVSTQAFKLDKDLVVYWRHKAGLPGSVDLVAHKSAGSDRGTFMMVVTPGDDLKPIKEGKDWVFVLDISGSMQGKYATLADGVERALKAMRPDDRFRIVLFNNTVQELTAGYINATADKVAHYSQLLNQITPHKGTNLYAGLQHGIRSLDAERTSALVLVTDGVANVGETHQRRFIELIKAKDTRLFAFVLGNSANRPLLEALTDASGGFSVNISNSDDLVGQLLAVKSKVTHEALHGVKISIDGVKTADMTPKQIGSLYRGQQLVVFGHYWGDGMANVELSGRISGEDKRYSTQFVFPKVATDNPEVERLWAYAQVEQAMQEINNFGENADLKQSIVDLGVEYGLVTDYTSMVVVRDEVFEQRGIKRNNKSRLAIEATAQQQRSQRPAVSHRVDTKKPMYSTSRASHGGSGGGALDIWTLLLLLPLIGVALQQRKARA